MKKCGKNCTACPYIKEVKSLYINKKEWKINQSLNCEIFNCIYLIECKKDNCNMKYVGETKRILKYRFAEHRGYVNNRDESQATGEHFNSVCLIWLSPFWRKLSQMMICTEKKEKNISSENSIHFTKDSTSNPKLEGSRRERGLSHYLLCKLLWNTSCHCCSWDPN